VTCSTRRRAPAAALALLALAAPGCVTGHLLDAARRRERPVAVHEAALDGDRLVLGYTASVCDDRGRPLGQAARRASVPLAQLGDASRPTDAFAVEHLAPDGPLPGRALVLVRSGDAPPAPPFVEVSALDEIASPSVTLHGRDGRVAPAFPTEALTQLTTRPWVYPLVPLSAAFDAATLPPLLLLGTPLFVLGD